MPRTWWGKSGQRLPLWLSLTCLLLLSVYVPSVDATILTFSGTTKKSPPFPKGTKLSVCIQEDPDGLGRSELLKKGVERWKKRLAVRMIDLEVSVVAPDKLPPPGGKPGGQDNKIVYTWVKSGQLGKMEIGPGKNNGAAQPIASKNGEKLVGGEAIIHRGLPAPTDKDKRNLLENIGEHEFTHILGLADDPGGEVTKHEQGTATRKFNPQDEAELNSLYGTATTGGAGKPKGNVQQTGGGSGMGFFRYRFDFKPANAVFDPNDPEHVAFITLGVKPQLVTGLALPPGWVALVPTGPLSITDPFFSEGYMIDGAPNPTPWAPGPPPAFVALRTSVQEAANDGLPSGFDPALTLNNPSFELTIFTPASMTRPMSVWAGGELQTVPGPFVPEPSSLLLLSSGFLGLAGFRRRHRV